MTAPALSCGEAVRLLEATVGDTETLPGVAASDVEALRTHVATCAACRAVRDEIRAGALALTAALAPTAAVAGGTADGAAADDRLVADVMRRIPAGRVLARRGFPWVRAAAVLVAVAVGSAAWSLRPKGSDPGSQDGGTSDVSSTSGADTTPTYRLSPPRVPDYAGPRFADVTDVARIEKVDHTGRSEGKDWMVETVGHGAAVLDMDGDGDLDLFVPDGNRLAPEDRVSDTWRLYRNDGGMRFTDVTDGSGLETDAWGCAAVAGDLDADGLPDLFVACFGRNRLFRNLGGGRFADATDAAGVGGDESEWSTGAALGDLDGDGDLDLYVANYADMRRFIVESGGPRRCNWRGMQVACGPQPLSPQADRLYLNRGDGTFEDGTTDRIPPNRRYSFQPVIVDADGDGRLDVFVAEDAQANVFLHNLGDARFVEQGVIAGLATNASGDEQACMGVASGDLDGDGAVDLYVTNFSHESNTLYRSLGRPGRPLFGDVTAAAGLDSAKHYTLGWGASFADFDSDGDLDVAYANGHLYPDVEKGVPETTYAQHVALFENDARGGVRLVTSAAGGGGVARVHRGLLVADFDDDGHLDFFVTVLNGRAALLRNDGRGAGRSARLVLRRRGGKIEAAGARVTARIVSGGTARIAVRDLLLGSSFASSEDPRVHLGLGADGAVVSFSVRWPGGAEEAFGALEAGGTYEVVEGRAEVRRLR